MHMDKAVEAGQVTVVRIKIYVLVVLGLAHVLATLFFIDPGYLSIDEIIYHWASRSFRQAWGFEILNGYREFPSPEMFHHFAPPYKGRPVMQYPYLFTVLSWPFYRVAGYYGLFLINAASFLGLVALCYATARKQFNDPDLALNACLILAAGTFAWEYSQAAWPHMTSAFIIMAAFYLFVCSYLALDESKSLYLALASGLVAGVAPSVRMEAILLFPALVLPFLFSRPWRPWEAAGVVVGTMPGLVAFALVNYVKFGKFSPVTYGGPAFVSAYLAGAAVTLLLVLWVLSRSSGEGFVKRYRNWLCPAALAVVAGLLLVPQTRSVLADSFVNAWVSVIDIRVLDLDLALPAMTRSAGGGVVYISGQKKALLQSLPYLAILVIPLVAIIRGHKDYPYLMMLFIMPVAALGYYGYAFYDSGAYAGGLCLNYRYAMPWLPFLSILCAYGVRRIETRWGKPSSCLTVLAACFVTAAAFFLLVRGPDVNLNDLEFPLLALPLIIAVTLLGMLLLGELIRPDRIRFLAPCVWALIAVAITWSSLVAFFYDYPMHRGHRSTNYQIGESVRKVVHPDSIIFMGPVVDSLMRVIETDGIRIAFPGNDRFNDFQKLLAFHLKAGRRVYGAFPEAWWNGLKEEPLKSHVVTPRLVPIPGLIVAEISLPDQSGRPKKR